MIPFKASCTIPHTSQQPSPILTDHIHRTNLNTQTKRTAGSTLTIQMGSNPTLPNLNGRNSSIKSTMNHNAYAHHGQITSRLTNV